MKLNIYNLLALFYKVKQPYSGGLDNSSYPSIICYQINAMLIYGEVGHIGEEREKTIETERTKNKSKMLR